jgi:hypothetical protein
MSAFPGGGNDLVSASSPIAVQMDGDAGSAPGMVDPISVTPGVIPVQPSHIQNLPPAASLSNVSAVLHALPSRMEVLQEALQLCSAAPSTRDDKLDLLLSMMTSMFKLMLLDHVGPSTGSSPLSLRLSSSNTSASSGGGPSSPHFGPDSSATAVIAGAQLQASGPGMPSQPLTAAAHFICPTCPSSKAPLTEKSFNKHILAWKQKVKGGVSACRKVKTGSCPGIRSLDHPLVAGLSGAIQERVDTVVDHTVSLLSPGASAAHTPAGTGNFRRVQAYFDYLKNLQP